MDKDRFKKVFLNKLWIAAVTTIVGIIAGVIIYALADTAANPDTVYVGYSEYYVDFAWNDNTGTTYDYYNAYTWNDIIGTDPIMDYAVGILPGVDKEYLRSVVTAELPSDIRVIHTIVTDTDADRVSLIQKAMEESIVHFGDIMEEFEGIRVIRSDKVRPEARIKKTGRAAETGGIVGLLTGLFGLLIWYCLDDRILCPSDVRRIVPDIPCIGMNELAGANICYLQEKYGDLSIVKVSGGLNSTGCRKIFDKKNLIEESISIKSRQGKEMIKESVCEKSINEIIAENPADIGKHIILCVEVYNHSGFDKNKEYNGVNFDDAKDKIEKDMNFSDTKDRKGRAVTVNDTTEKDMSIGNTKEKNLKGNRSKRKYVKEQELLNCIDALKLREFAILGICLKDVEK